MNAYTFWKELDRLSEGLLTSAAVPRVDVAEAKDRYEVVAELPGFNKDLVTVEVKDGVLELKASLPNQADAPEGGETQWILKERRNTTYQRSFRLPQDVDSDAIEANFRDGLLVLTLPKKEEAKPRLVTIKAA
jgi:HSP20 family molecular chaperone IbpA